jgi:outer membrane receptor protein involved in Fe transport
MPMEIKWPCIVTCVGLLAVVAPSANAQSMDYGALEQIFAEPVTTSVTGSPQRASQVPAGIEIITAEDIRRSGARDIPGVLRGLNGVDPVAILVRVPGYLSADARAAYRLTTRATLALAGQNLLHDQQIRTANSAVERRVLATLSVDY